MVGVATLDRHIEAVEQAMVADDLVVTKTDARTAPAGHVAELLARLRGLNPHARIVRTGDAREMAAWLQTGGAPVLKTPPFAGPAADHVHRLHGVEGGRALHTFTLVRDAGLTRADLDLFARAIRDSYGERLLRMKGILALADRGDAPASLHAVQGAPHALQPLRAWPSADQRTRLVLITDGVTREEVEELLARVEAMGRRGVRGQPPAAVAA